MNLYLAARYSRRTEMLERAAELTALGHHITSRWITVSHRLSPGMSDEEELSVRRRFAEVDREDLGHAHGLVCFTEAVPYPRDWEPGRGGRHVELGMALAWALHILIVGSRENVFCCLPEVEFCPTWPEALTLLSGPWGSWRRAAILGQPASNTEAHRHGEGHAG